MKGVRHAGLVGADATYLDSVRSVRRAPVDERWPNERNDVMSSGEDEVSNETFVAVNDEVPAKLFWFFMVSYKFSGRHSAQIATHGLQVG